MSPIFAFAIVGYLVVYAGWIAGSLWAFNRFAPLSPYAPAGRAALWELARWGVALFGLHILAALLFHSA